MPSSKPVEKSAGYVYLQLSLKNVDIASAFYTFASQERTGKVQGNICPAKHTQHSCISPQSMLNKKITDAITFSP